MKRFLLFCLLISATSVLLPLTAAAQPSQKEAKFMQLLCRSWKTFVFEQNGVQGEPTPEQKDDKLVFYKDFRVLSVEGGHQQWGTWKHDAANETITMTDKNTKRAYTVKILELTNKTLVLAYTDRLGNKLKFYMRAI